MPRTRRHFPLAFRPSPAILLADGDDMKKNSQNSNADAHRDTMRPKHDFSKAVRGVTAAPYA